MFRHKWVGRLRPPTGRDQFQSMEFLFFMSHMTYTRRSEGAKDKPLSWLHGEVRTPPISKDARTKAGFLLRRLQSGDFWACPIPGLCPLLENDAMS